ncbi:MAG: tRNA-dihydrouridine synthase family protein [Pseudomonadota bacterium]
MPLFLSLAPIRGFTNALYRNLYSRHFKGIDAAIAPFITTLCAKQINRAHIKDILPENNNGMPVVPQIIGNDPAAFIQLATTFHNLGYPTVNWNLGCPFPMVAKKRRGSGMLPHPRMIAAFLDAVIPRIPTRMSIKARIGREKKEEIFHLLPIFNQYPLEEIILHPRTGVQMYTGAVDLDTFEQCLALLNLPVTYNGDIFDYASFISLRDRFRTVSRWLIGRGVLANPFLPGILRSGEETIFEPVKRFKKFHDELFEGYRAELSGPSHLVDKMKGYWLYFFRSFETGEAFFKKMKKVTAVKKYEELVSRFFEEEAVWRPEIRF